jgi:hypothetical protein
LPGREEQRAVLAASAAERAEEELRPRVEAPDSGAARARRAAGAVPAVRALVAAVRLELLAGRPPVEPEQALRHLFRVRQAAEGAGSLRLLLRVAPVVAVGRVAVRRVPPEALPAPPDHEAPARSPAPENPRRAAGRPERRKAAAGRAERANPPRTPEPGSQLDERAEPGLEHPAPAPGAHRNLPGAAVHVAGRRPRAALGDKLPAQPLRSV